MTATINPDFYSVLLAVPFPVLTDKILQLRSATGKGGMVERIGKMFRWLSKLGVATDRHCPKKMCLGGFDLLVNDK